MPIARSLTSERRVAFSTVQIELLKTNQGKLNLMKNADAASNPDLRGADSIRFEPNLIVPERRAQPVQPSTQRVITQEQMNMVYFAGGVLVFLVALKYLTN